MSDLNNYGRFLDEERCFELNAEPPRKWINLHCNRIGDDEMYAEVSNIGDGPVAVRDKDGCSVTLVNWDAKYLYVRDEDSGTVFCPAGSPAPTPVEDSSCRYYLDRTVISGTCEGLRASQRMFVPRDHPVECWTLNVENLTDRPRKISVFAYVKFHLGGCDAEGGGVWPNNFAEVHPEIGGVFCTNRSAFTPTDRFKGYLVTLDNFAGGNAYRDHFLRQEFAVGTPRILDGWNCDGRPGCGPDCAGIVQVTLEIAPGATGRADFLLGQASCVEDVHAVRAALTPARLDELCAEVAEVEAARADTFHVETGNPDYDSLMNIFVKKQLYNYLINKSGFRDNLQTDYPLAMVDYAAAEANLLRALGSQYPNGCVPHGFRPLNRLQYADKPAWIMLTVPALLQESGDMSLLDRQVGFLEGDERTSVWDHMLRAMRFLATDLGPNGLCDQHHADWNDGLEATQEAGERESVFVTMQLCYGLLQMQEIARRRGEMDVADEAARLHTTFADRLNAVAWDGEWYVRTICGDGYRIGSHENNDGKIFINTQSWAVLSGVATGERAAQCMASIDKHIERDIGFPLCTPAFSSYDPRVGKMSNSMVGAAENGGCYCHGAGFKGVADCVLGRAEEAWRTFVKIAPGNPENPYARAGGEPFSFVNFYTTVPYIYGQAGYGWRTGTAGWMTTLLVEFILGAKRGWDGLTIDPCLTATIPHAKVTRRFRGASYNITLDNTAGRCTGTTSITVDGEKIEGNVLPLFDGGEHEVAVVI